MSGSEVASRDEFFDSLLGDFLDESGQLLDRLNENLLRLDDWVRGLAGEAGRRRCDDDLLNEMFRAAHSLKGLSAMLGLGEINRLTHKIENVFDAARKEELPVTSDVVELIFQGVDRLGALVGALRDPEAGGIDCETVIESIAHMLRDAGVERAQTTQADAERALAHEPPADPVPSPPASAEATEPDEARATQAHPDFADLRDEADTAGKYLSIFIDEAELSLDSFNETLLALEAGGSRNEIEQLLITAHRLKGSAASIGLNRAAKLAHHMEDRLQEILEHGRTLSPEMADAMLQCVDALRQYVAGLRAGGDAPAHFDEPARKLDAAHASARRAAGASDEPATALDEALHGCALQCTPDPERTLLGEVKFDADLPLTGLKGRLLLEKLGQLGEVCHVDPPADVLEDVDSITGLRFVLVTSFPRVVVENRLRVGGVRAVIVERLRAPSETRLAESSQPSRAAPAASEAPARRETPDLESDENAKAAAAARGEAATRPTETLRVDIERLDQLMNLAGELVINKARFVRIGDRLREAAGAKRAQNMFDSALASLARIASNESDADPAHARRALAEARAQARHLQVELEAVRREVAALGAVHGAVNDLFEAIHQLDRVSAGIQRNVMDTRMVPIGPLFGRFKRVVRDITRANGKQIRLEIHGEKTELDKRMIDELGDPLIHMVRNSADHGVEAPEAREAAGKPREGTIRLDAFHCGNHIVIQVRDDGRGLDPQRILRKAIDKGLVAEAEAAKLSVAQIHALIWEPGLSTAEKVTEVSGRGMGMDIVKSKIDELRGTIELDSAPGQGTTITVKLPLTLAILPSLMVNIGGDVYAMPVESVAEIVRVKPRELSTVHGRWAASVRGRVISVVRLDDVFQRPVTQSETAAMGTGETTLVILGDQGREIALVVDDVLGEEDIVIKSLAENYRNVVGVAGASILGDGRVSLILDIAALVELAVQVNSRG